MEHIEQALEAFCGDSYPDLVAKIGTDGIADLCRALSDIEDRFGGDDSSIQEHWNGALEVAYGDSTLVQIAEARHKALVAYREAHDKLLGALVASSVLHSKREADLARESGLSRPTIRKALGL